MANSKKNKTLVSKEVINILKSNPKVLRDTGKKSNRIQGGIYLQRLQRFLQIEKNPIRRLHIGSAKDFKDCCKSKNI